MPRINLPVLIWILYILNLDALISQSLFIELNPKHLKFSDNRFYLTEVVDVRKNKDCIGQVLNKEKDPVICLDFKLGLELAIMYYLKPALPAGTDKIPITIKVADLWVNQHVSNNKSTVVTFVQLEVYHMEDGTESKFFQTSLQKENKEDNPEINFGTEIEIILRDCLIKLKHDPTVEDFTNKIIQPIIQPYKFTHRLTLARSIGLDAKSYSIQYYGYQYYPLHDWVFPIAFSTDFFSIQGNHSKHLIFEGSKIAFASPGISAFKNLSPYWWLNLRGQVPIGSEKAVLWQGTNNNFVIGLSLSQSLMMIPVEQAGFTFGIGAYQRILKSQIYPWDLGITIDVGVKF